MDEALALALDPQTGQGGAHSSSMSLRSRVLQVNCLITAVSCRDATCRKNPVHFREYSHNTGTDDRPECPYGTSCYRYSHVYIHVSHTVHAHTPICRKNPTHRKNFKHTSPPTVSKATRHTRPKTMKGSGSILHSVVSLSF